MPQQQRNPANKQKAKPPTSQRPQQQNKPPRSSAPIKAAPVTREARQGREYRFTEQYGRTQTRRPTPKSITPREARRREEARRQAELERIAAEREAVRRAREEARANREPTVIEQLFELLYLKMKKKMGAFRAVFTMILCLYLAIMLTAVGINAAQFFGNAERHSDVTTVTGLDSTEKNAKKTSERPYSSVFRSSGEPYVNFTAMAEECDLLTIGNNKQIRFILPDGSGQSILLVNGSKTVQIDAATVVMSAPAEISVRTVYLPLSFVNRYITGYRAEYSKKDNTLTLLRLQDPENTTEKLTVYQPLGFGIYGQFALHPIDPIFPEES